MKCVAVSALEAEFACEMHALKPITVCKCVWCVPVSP